MSEHPLDAAWVRQACAAQGVAVTPEESAELAANLQGPLDALERMAVARRFEDEPAAFAKLLARHSALARQGQPDPP